MSANEAIRNRALTSIFVSNEKFWTTLGAKPPGKPTFYQLLTMREMSHFTYGAGAITFFTRRYP
jgi:hypothetical protein